LPCTTETAHIPLYFRLCLWWWCIEVLPWRWWVSYHSVYLDWSTWSKV